VAPAVRERPPSYDNKYPDPGRKQCLSTVAPPPSLGDDVTLSLEERPISA